MEQEKLITGGLYGGGKGRELIPGSAAKKAQTSH